MLLLYVFLFFPLLTFFVYYNSITSIEAQFANTSKLLQFEEKGIMTENVTDTGLLTNLLIELKSPYNTTAILNDTASSLIKRIEETNVLNATATILDDLSIISIDYSPNPNYENILASPPTLEETTEFLIDIVNEDPRVNNTEVEEIYSAQYETAQVDNSSMILIRQANFSQIIPTGIDRIDSDVTNKKITDLFNDTAVDVDIAILDSGINPHPDLTLLLDKQVYFTGNDVSDNCGHGTHVAGIAAAKNNDFGVMGTAPGARVWNVKVLELKSNGECLANKTSILNGLNYVLQHANEIEVVNLSLGGYCDPSTRNFCNSEALEKKIDRLIEKGVVVVVAAGNGIHDVGIDAKDWKPAKIAPAITVSNFVDSDGKCGRLGNATYRGLDDSLASNSNYGAPIDISAPGINVLSTSKDNGYVFYSGTSMASPHVAGAAALYKALNPNATVTDIIDVLESTGIQNFNIQCVEDSFGYIKGGDKDSDPEPLIHMKRLVDN